LRQEYIQVQVPGNLLVLSGQFAVRFDITNSQVRLDLVLNTPVVSISNAKVQVFLGTADPQGIHHRREGKLSSTAPRDSRSRSIRASTLRIKLKNTVLTQALAIANSTVVNGYGRAGKGPDFGNGSATTLRDQARFRLQRHGRKIRRRQETALRSWSETEGMFTLKERESRRFAGFFL
jgi:hypothetical protein